MCRTCLIGIAFLVLMGASQKTGRTSIFEPLEQQRAAGGDWRDGRVLTEASKRAEVAGDSLAAAALKAAEAWGQRTKVQTALRSFESALEKLAAGSGRRQAVDELQRTEKSYSGSPNLPVDLIVLDPGYPPEIVTRANAERTLEVILLLNIGALYASQNQLDAAEVAWRFARDTASRNGLEDFEGSVEVNLAWLALRTDNVQRIDDLLESLLKDGKAVPAPELHRRIKLLQGVRLRDRNKLPESIAALRDTDALYRSAADPLRGRVLAQLATTYAASGALDAALRNYREALTASPDDFEVRWHSHCGLADAYRRKESAQLASEQYAVCIEEIQARSDELATDQGKLTFLGGFQDVYDAYLEMTYLAAVANADWLRLRNAVESVRARSLDALNRVDRAPLDVAGLLSESDLEIARSMSPVAQLAPYIPSPGNVATPEPEPPSAPLNRPGPTFLEYYVLPQRTLIVVRAPDGRVHAASAAIGRAQMRELVTRYRRFLGQEFARGPHAGRGVKVIAEEAPATETGKVIYNRIIAPVRKFLPRSTQDLLVIIPHDALWELPFEALPSAPARFLIDDHLTAYGASERIWTRQVARPRKYDHSNVRAWIAGNPRLPQGLSACGTPATFETITGAEQEARDIAARIGPERADLFIGQQADRFRLLAWHGNYSVIHLAAHGFTCTSDPLDSAIVLTDVRTQEVHYEPLLCTSTLRHDSRLPVKFGCADQIPRSFAVRGLLTARDVASRFRFHADLVFLSACQSGIGTLSGDGMLGFARAFEGAGARSLVLSLWLVSDASAPLLTKTFYDEYLKHGNKAVALRRAMLETRRKFPEVSDWAAFRLTGPAN